MIGAALGALLVWLVYKDHFNATDDPDAELGVFCTSPAIKDYPINFLGEMIGTFAITVIEEDQIDIRGHVKFRAAQLTHTHDEQILRHAVL